MSVSPQQRDNEPVSGDQQVADYLRADPEFFVRNAELVGSLRIPHGQPGAVSLLEHQVSVLRGQTEELRDKLQQLVANARDNEELSQRMHRLTLSLIEARSLDEIFATLYQSLSEQFQADVAAVRLFVPARAGRDRGLGEFVTPDAALHARFERALAADKPICGRPPAAQSEFLFGEHAAETRSAALLALGDARRFGLLAIGSRDAERFHPGMGTLFLRNLAEVVTRVLVPHIDIG